MSPPRSPVTTQSNPIRVRNIERAVVKEPDRSDFGPDPDYQGYIVAGEVLALDPTTFVGCNRVDRTTRCTC